MRIAVLTCTECHGKGQVMYSTRDLDYCCRCKGDGVEHCDECGQPAVADSKQDGCLCLAHEIERLVDGAGYDVEMPPGIEAFDIAVPAAASAWIRA